PKDFGRMAAQAAKQVIVQKMREASRQAVYNYVNLPGNQEAVMAPNDQMPNERYHMGDRIKVLVNKVENNLSLIHILKKCQRFTMVRLKLCSR
ncbi:hypothetical protein BMS84_04770, partial [Leuconostoc pseudomesenteroides]